MPFILCFVALQQAVLTVWEVLTARPNIDGVVGFWRCMMSRLNKTAILAYENFDRSILFFQLGSTLASSLLFRADVSAPDGWKYRISVREGGKVLTVSRAWRKENIEWSSDLDDCWDKSDRSSVENVYSISKCFEFDGCRKMLWIRLVRIFHCASFLVRPPGNLVVWDALCDAYEHDESRSLDDWIVALRRTYRDLIILWMTWLYCRKGLYQFYGCENVLWEVAYHHFGAEDRRRTSLLFRQETRNGTFVSCSTYIVVLSDSMFEFIADFNRPEAKVKSALTEIKSHERFHCGRDMMFTPQFLFRSSISRFSLEKGIDKLRCCIWIYGYGSARKILFVFPLAALTFSPIRFVLIRNSVLQFCFIESPFHVCPKHIGTLVFFIYNLIHHQKRK